MLGVGAATVRHKFDVLERHCARAGRDPAEITKTVFVFGTDDLAGFEAGARAYAQAGADGIAVVGPADPGRIPAIGEVLGEVFPDLGLRRMVYGAFSQIGEVACGGHEVAVVMEHNEVMMRRGGADQQVHGRQRTVCSIAQQAILRRLYPPPGTLGDRGVGVERIEHFRHLLVLVDGAG